jgi:pimeloyl-ACP methyl ester carboxylesterase
LESRNSFEVKTGVTLNRHNIDHVLRLSDGRELVFGDYGDPDGEPIILVHGFPGSRHYWKVLPGFPFLPNLRIIAPDRPGWGSSDLKPDRTMLDWADNVAELADALGIERFAIAGVSGGGPETLACAWKIPERLTVVGVIHSPAPPFVTPNYFEGLSRTNAFFYRLTEVFPWLSRKNLEFLGPRIRENPEKWLRMNEGKLAGADKEAFNRPAVFEVMKTAMVEGYRQDGRAAGIDMILHHGRPWGFPLEEIKVKGKIVLICT